MIGQNINHYQITAKLGQGGMGVVYQATDTRLGREVALKILPEKFVQDPQRMSRFQREAEVLASLNHPNISIIHGLEEAHGVRELVEGPTLAERIAEGPIPLEEALKIALEITQALEAAHGKGIIHRDLKPANVKITLEGKVKVLDFGLAKALEPELSHEELANSPTLTMEATQAGMILGTAAYMSPEQARGRPVDKRTDIWAFGCVLLECLTAKQEFGGETVSDSIAKILQKEPGWDALPKETPLGVQRLLRRCLEKDLGSRLRDIGDAGLEIAEGLSEPVGVTTATSARWQRPIPLAALGLLVVLLGVFVGAFLWNLENDSPLGPVTRFSIVLPDGEAIPQRTSLALSPDGTQLVYAAVRDGTRRLYRRSLNQQNAQSIPGTENGHSPFFSPDGQWVGFFSGTRRGEGELKKWSVLGGQPLKICDVTVGQGASWGEDDTIIFSDRDRLWRISSAGSTPEPAVPEGGDSIYPYAPQVLPGGKEVLLWIYNSRARASVGVVSLDSGQEKILVNGCLKGRYLPSGHLVYGQGNSLMAAPFDLESLELVGPGRPVVEGVWVGGRTVSKFEVSRNGSLVYVPGSNPHREDTLVWVDRQGQEEVFLESRMELEVPRISPDGRQLAVQVRTGVFLNTWTCEIERCVLSQLANSGVAPVWSRDGRELFFHEVDIIRIAADGSGEPERVLERGDAAAAYPMATSPDGKVLLVDRAGDILALPLDRDAKTDPVRVEEVFVDKGRLSGYAPDFSPDGNWIVFTSNRSERDEIYVKPYPGQGGLVAVTTEGGSRPRWSPDGREIFYRRGAKMMAVSIQVQPSPRVGKPRELFEGPPPGPYATRHYDIRPDGQRFLMVKRGKTEEVPPPNQINVVLNWSEELKQKVPVGD